jgi:hypothetical protein
MDKKNLIIGGIQNYNINQIKPWVLSINEVCDKNVDKVVCISNLSQETKTWLQSQGFILVEMAQDSRIPIHVLRFLYIYEYLKEKHTEYQYVITTDVKDVYFQKDPFEHMHKMLASTNKKLIAGSEGMLYKDEPWGNENLLQAYGPYVHEIFKDNEIYNVGTLAGHADYIKDLVFNIFTNGINRPIPIVDQAVYNVLINTQPYKDVTLFLKQKSGWAMQAGTTVDPSKIDMFRPFLTEPEPIFENGRVKTRDKVEFTIVHQYDRVPEWKKHVMQSYGQQDESDYFIYKV